MMELWFKWGHPRLSQKEPFSDETRRLNCHENVK